MSFSNEKFCIIPGTPEVRLADLSGHVTVITETPKPILDIFVLQARGKGCITEKELADLKARLIPGEDGKEDGKDEGGKEDGKQEPEGKKEEGKKEEGKGQDLDKERFEKIVAAVIELVNTGDPASFEKNSGKPKVAALADKCGFEVSGAERDAAFEAASK